jgi:hypothetical protein
MTGVEDVAIFILEKDLARKKPESMVRAFFEYKYCNILNPSHSSYLPAYEDGTECSETLAYKIQMPGNYPAESIQQILKCSCINSLKQTAVTF